MSRVALGAAESAVQWSVYKRPVCNAQFGYWFGQYSGDRWTVRVTAGMLACAEHVSCEFRARPAHLSHTGSPRSMLRYRDTDDVRETQLTSQREETESCQTINAEQGTYRCQFGIEHIQTARESKVLTSRSKNNTKKTLREVTQMPEISHKITLQTQTGQRYLCLPSHIHGLIHTDMPQCGYTRQSAPHSSHRTRPHPTLQPAQRPV